MVYFTSIPWSEYLQATCQQVPNVLGCVWKRPNSLHVAWLWLLEVHDVGDAEPVLGHLPADDHYLVLGWVCWHEETEYSREGRIGGMYDINWSSSTLPCPGLPHCPGELPVRGGHAAGGGAGHGLVPLQGGLPPGHSLRRLPHQQEVAAQRGHVPPSHNAAAGEKLCNFMLWFRYFITLQAGLIRNEAKFTTHVPEETLDPLGMEHLYFRKQKFCMMFNTSINIFSTTDPLCWPWHFFSHLYDWKVNC